MSPSKAQASGKAASPASAQKQKAAQAQDSSKQKPSERQEQRKTIEAEEVAAAAEEAAPPPPPLDSRSNIKMHNPTNPPPVAKEAPPASWHTTNSAGECSRCNPMYFRSTLQFHSHTHPSRPSARTESSTTAEALRNPPPSVPSGLKPGYSAAASGSNAKRSTTAASAETSTGKCPVPHHEHAEEKAGSGSGSTKSEGGNDAPGKCPVAHDSAPPSESKKEEEEEEEEEDEMDDEERMLLEGCSFARKKAMQLKRAKDVEDGDIFAGVDDDDAEEDDGRAVKQEEEEEEDDEARDASRGSSKTRSSVGREGSKPADADANAERSYRSRSAKAAIGKSDSKAERKSAGKHAAFSLPEDEGKTGGGGGTENEDDEDDDMVNFGILGGEAMHARRSLPGYTSLGEGTSLAAVGAAVGANATRASGQAMAIKTLTPEQQARARQQVRADLAGIDKRALKGPLRDLMSNPNYSGEVPGSLWTAGTGSGVDESGDGGRPGMGGRKRSNSVDSNSLLFPSPSPPLFNGAVPPAPCRASRCSLASSAPLSPRCPGIHAELRRTRRCRLGPCLGQTAA